MGALLKFARNYAVNRNVPLKRLLTPATMRVPSTQKDLAELESLHKVLDMYIWLSYRLEDAFADRDRTETSVQRIYRAGTELSSRKAAKRELIQNLIEEGRLPEDETPGAQRASMYNLNIGQVCGMGRKAWAMVMCCEELVALIVTYLGRRDLARCCSVSKLWNQCCRWQLAHGRGLGFLIAPTEGSKLWMCDSNTGEEQWVPLGLSDSAVLGACQGLVLIESRGVLAIGEPSVKRWKLLWRPRIDAISAWLGRVQGQLLILIIDKSGAVQKYDFANDSWIDVCRPSRRIALMEECVLIRGGCYRLFEKLTHGHDYVFDDIYKLDLRRGVWDKMNMRRESVRKFECLRIEKKVVEWRGKALMYTLKVFDQEEELREGRGFDTPRLYELLVDKGKVVELPTRLDAANVLSPELPEVVSDDYDLFWITRDRNVFKYSVADLSFNKLVLDSDAAPNLYLPRAFFYIPDGGEALSRNILSHLPDVPHDY
ncbi:hypothetical protein SELMODRAFT_420764 [Selaginella moellendorffii]|uniref:Uncharacterized protein n=1 Tax=Selaginella moellendorffii TaxID=88036 RepID=D8SD15_SELML|nr:hypothetical protein SELMODRAFT_420764 [Selaginella moellendorffii]